METPLRDKLSSLWAFLAGVLLLATAAGCTSPASKPSRDVTPQAKFNPVIRTFSHPQTHNQIKWLDQGVTSSGDYPQLRSPPSVLDHIGHYGITKSQFEHFIVTAQQMSIHEHQANYDSSRSFVCYVNPYSGFGGGTVFIFVPVQTTSNTSGYAVYGLHIRLRELQFRYFDG